MCRRVRAIGAAIASAVSEILTSAADLRENSMRFQEVNMCGCTGDRFAGDFGDRAGGRFQQVS